MKVWTEDDERQLARIAAALGIPAGASLQQVAEAVEVRAAALQEIAAMLRGEK